MKKVLSALIAAVFAFASVSAFAGAHGGAMKDADKKMADCKMMDASKADAKMQAECKKMMEEKKADAPKK